MLRFGQACTHDGGGGRTRRSYTSPVYVDREDRDRIAGHRAFGSTWTQIEARVYTMNEDMLRETKRAARTAFAGTRVFLAYAYGSRIIGRARPESDLDIGYYLTGGPEGAPLPLHDEMVLAERLSRGTGMEVDLRNLGAAPLELRGRVIEEGIRIFCSDERARVHLESGLLSRYHDYKPMFAAMHETRLAALASSG